MTDSICIVSSSRADYNFLHSIIKSLHKSRLRIDLALIISEDEIRHHSRIEEILQDGFEPQILVSYPNPSSKLEIQASLSRIMNDFAKEMEKRKPKCIVVFGDRIEVFAVSFVAFVLDISLVHIAGGEVSLGSKDEKFRQMITDLALLHIPISMNGIDRLLSQGVSSKDIFFAGDPSQDNLKILLREASATRIDLFKKYDLAQDQPILVFAFHPVSMLPDYGYAELSETVEALESILNRYSLQIVMTDRNSDFAPKEFDELLQQLRTRHPKDVTYIPNLGRNDFVRVLSITKLLVGNSSSSFYEASYLGIPSLSIGTRQKGRHTSDFVKFVPAQRGLIINAITDSFGKPPASRNFEFSGNVGELIANRIISSITESGAQ